MWRAYLAGHPFPQEPTCQKAFIQICPGFSRFSVLPPLPLWLVFGHNMKSSNDFIGRIVIGQYSSGPSESNHWRRMLSAHRTAV